VFLVTMNAGDQSKPTFPVPSNPSGTIALPASFTVELDRSLTGPVTIAIDAQDAGGNTIASGQTTQEHINTGGETVIAVNIVAPATQSPPGTDGGGV
jgi:hypothetical protein